jgi:hypothetical protein
MAVGAVIATGAASALASGGFGADCSERRTAGLEAAVSDWPSDGSFFNLAPRSPILMP